MLAWFLSCSKGKLAEVDGSLIDEERDESISWSFATGISEIDEDSTRF